MEQAVGKTPALAEEGAPWLDPGSLLQEDPLGLGFVSLGLVVEGGEALPIQFPL